MNDDAIRIGCLLLSALAAGCIDDDAPVNSLDVSTRDITVSVETSDIGDGATVGIRIGSPLGMMWLSGGDTLRVEMAGTPLEMREVRDDMDVPSYQAEVPELLGDLSLTIERPSDLSIDHLPISIPLPPKLFAEPIVGDFPLTLSWDAAPDEEHVATFIIEGDCIQTLQRTLANDTGSYAVQLAEFFPVDKANPTACPLTVSLTRYKSYNAELMPGSGKSGLYSWSTAGRTIEVGWTK